MNSKLIKEILVWLLLLTNTCLMLSFVVKTREQRSMINSLAELTWCQSQLIEKLKEENLELMIRTSGVTNSLPYGPRKDWCKHGRK